MCFSERIRRKVSVLPCLRTRALPEGQRFSIFFGILPFHVSSQEFHTAVPVTSTDLARTSRASSEDGDCCTGANISLEGLASAVAPGAREPDAAGECLDGGLRLLVVLDGSFERCAAVLFGLAADCSLCVNQNASAYVPWFDINSFSFHLLL